MHQFFVRLNFYPTLRINAALQFCSERHFGLLLRKAATVGAHPPALFALLPLILAFFAALFVRAYYEYEYWISRTAPAVPQLKALPAVLSTTAVGAIAPTNPTVQTFGSAVGKTIRGFDEFGRLWGVLFFGAGYSLLRFVEAG